MTHPILALQSTLVPALRADPELTVFDAPPAGKTPPYVTIARHDVRPRDGDLTPGHEHRVVFHCWAADASRKSAVAMAEKVVAIVMSASLDSAGMLVTLRRHERTETAMDAETGRARAAVAVTVFTEPS